MCKFELLIRLLSNFELISYVIKVLYNDLMICQNIRHQFVDILYYNNLIWPEMSLYDFMYNTTVK